MNVTFTKELRTKAEVRSISTRHIYINKYLKLVTKDRSFNIISDISRGHKPVRFIHPCYTDHWVQFTETLSMRQTDGPS